MAEGSTVGRLARRARAGAGRLRREIGERRAPVAAPPRPPRLHTAVRLLVGPANFAGQGWAWARAVERAVPDVGAHAFAVLTGRLDFPADYAVPREAFVSARWQREQRAFVTKHYTHVLVEAARPVLGARPPYGDRCTGDLPILRSAGLRVAMLAHGSDVRVPSEHVSRYPWSPFTDLPAARLRTLEHNATANRALMREHDGPVFVSTPDLLDELPDAAWLPVVVDPDRWASDQPVLRRDRPIVVHAPSSSPMKGSDLIDPVMARLHDAGVVDYRRIVDAAPTDMPALYGDADIVLDQFRLGSYGVAACEALAAGRLVIGQVTDENRSRVRSLTGHELPIVEAAPDTLADTIRGLLDDPDQARHTAAAGAAFVREVHDGSLAARGLASFVSPA